MSKELHELIDLEGLTPQQRSRVECVHALLHEAGPPAELPVALVEPPVEQRIARIIPFRQRRVAGALLVAASIAVVCFGCGYVIADAVQPAGLQAVKVISLQGSGAHDSFAALRIGAANRDGNMPVELTVRGLPSLAGTHERYALVFSQGARASSVIGMFTVGARGSTTVTFSVPFTIRSGMHFAVTEVSATGQQSPGHVVMTNS